METPRARFALLALMALATLVFVLGSFAAAIYMPAEARAADSPEEVAASGPAASLDAPASDPAASPDAPASDPAASPAFTTSSTMPDVKTFTVNCYLNGTEERIAPPRVRVAQAGETVQVTPATIDGYTPVSPDAKALKVTGDDPSADFYYYKNVTLVADGPSADPVTYDGRDHTSSYSVKGELEGHEVDFGDVKLNERYRDAGTYHVSFPNGTVGTVDKSQTYVVSECVDGTYVIKPAPISISTPSASKVYDGKPLAAKKDATIKGLVNGEKCGFEVVGSQTEVGTSRNAYEITWASGEGSAANGFSARESNYVVESVMVGSLTVAESADTVVVTTTGGTFAYDAKAHGTTVSVSGLPSGYTVKTAKSSATATDVTSEPIAATADDLVIQDKSGADVTDKLKIVRADGELAIVPRPVQVYVQGRTNDADVFFDGNEHEVNGYTAHADQALYDVAHDVVFSGVARARRTDAGTEPMGLTAEQFRNTDGNFDVTFVVADGSITVRKATSSVVVGSVRHPVWTQGSSGAPSIHASVVGINNYADPAIEFKSASSDEFTSEEPTETGTYTVRATWGETDNCEEISATSLFTIAPAEGEGPAGAAPTAAPASAAASDTSAAAAPAADAAAPKVTVTTTGGTFAYDGQPHGATVEVDGLSDGYVVERAASSATATDVTAEPIPATADDLVIRDASGADVTAKLDIAYNDDTLAVTPRNAVVTVYDAVKEFSAHDPAFTADIEGVIEGDEVELEYTRAEGEDIGWYSIDAAATGASSANYAFTYVPGTLTITRNTSRAIVLTAPSLTKSYDGRELTATSEGAGITVSPLAQSGVPSGFKAQVTSYDGAIVNASTTANLINACEILDADGVDKRSSFNSVKLVPGTLTVKRRVVTLASAGGHKVYDGNPLTSDEVTVGGDGFAGDEGAGVSFEVTGMQTIVGNSQNDFTYKFDSSVAKADNYDVRQVLGTLVVTNRFENDLFQIAVRAKSDSVLYDGQEKSVSGLETDTFTVGGNTYRVEGLEASARGVGAGCYASRLTGTPVVRDSNNNDVTGQFHVSEADGLLEIRKRTLAFESASAEKLSDGKELTCEDVTVEGDGFAPGEGASFEVTGSQTGIGSSPNVFTWTFDEGTDEDNYRVSSPDSYGTLTVASRDARTELTVVARSGEFLYDGSEKSVDGLKSQLFTFDGVTYAIEGLSASARATDAGTYVVGIEGKPVIRDSEGTDVTDRFAVKTVPGELRINKRAITLTSSSASRPYDGQPFMYDFVEITGDGFAMGEGASFDVTGLQILPGSAENTFTYALDEGTDPGNYDITTSFGRLSVTNRDARHEITLQAKSDEVRYDGSEHAVEGFETLTFEVDGGVYTVEGVEAHAAGTEAGVYTTQVTGEPRVMDSELNDVTAQFAVHVLNGELRVRSTNTLTIKYLTDEGLEMAAPFVGSYEPGSSFGPVISPAVPGYSPGVASVSNGHEGMPDRDVEVLVVYSPHEGHEIWLSPEGELHEGEVPGGTPFEGEIAVPVNVVPTPVVAVAKPEGGAFAPTPTAATLLNAQRGAVPDAVLVVSGSGDVSLAALAEEHVRLGVADNARSWPAPMSLTGIVGALVAVAGVAALAVVLARRRRG